MKIMLALMIMLILMSQLLLPMVIRVESIQIDRLILKTKINNHKVTIINSKTK